MAKEKEVVKPEERPDEEVLLDEFEVELLSSEKTVIVKPWSWGVYGKIAPTIDKAITVVEQSNLDVSGLRFIPEQREFVVRMMEGKKLTKAEKEEYNTMAGKASMAIMRLLAKISPYVVDIIAASCNLKKEEIEELSPLDIFQLGCTIYFVNPTVLGNAYPSFDDTSR